GQQREGGERLPAGFRFRLVHCCGSELRGFDRNSIITKPKNENAAWINCQSQKKRAASAARDLFNEVNLEWGLPLGQPGTDTEHAEGGNDCERDCGRLWHCIDDEGQTCYTAVVRIVDVLSSPNC